MNAAVLGVRPLVRLALRRDRIMLPAWSAALLLLAITSAVATVGLYPTADQVRLAAASMNNTPAMVAIYGRILDESSIGALSMLKASGTGSLLVAVLAVITVIRHTRAEEDGGRLELVGATRVGRLAPLTAALTVACGTSLVLGLLTSIGLIISGLPVAGSIAFGLSWSGVGIGFAAVAAVTAQVAASRRLATGLALGIAGVFFLLRAVGDTATADGPRWLSWLSPLGWSQQLRPYASERWWVVALVAVFALAATALAYRLASRRDLGAGLFAERPGPAVAGALLGSPLTLALRLHRATLLAWAAGFTVYGLLVGSVADSVSGMMSTPEARRFVTALGGQQAFTDAVLAAMLAMLAVAASGYGIQAALRPHAEEVELRAELLLTTPVSRTRWLVAHVLAALAGTAALLLVAGAAVGTAHAVQTGDPTQLWRLIGAGLAQVPATWVLVGAVVLLYGFAPRLAAASWAILVGFLLLSEIGPLLEFDQWALDLSPFTHSPRLPGGVVGVGALAWLTTVAAVLVAAGLAGFRRRDIG